jgi:predicted DNA-binding transcriptional regulator AlpA
MHTDTTAREYLTPQQAGHYVGLTERTLTEKRRNGTGPRYTRLGGPTGRVRYSRQELDRWMESRTFESTSGETVSRYDAA